MRKIPKDVRILHKFSWQTNCSYGDWLGTILSLCKSLYNSSEQGKPLCPVKLSKSVKINGLSLSSGVFVGFFHFVSKLWNSTIYPVKLFLPSAKEIWGKVIFSEASVILFTEGGVCLQGEGVWLQGRGSAYRGRGVCIGGGVGRPPVAEPEKRTVCILLECFLVYHHVNSTCKTVRNPLGDIAFAFIFDSCEWSFIVLCFIIVVMVFSPLKFRDLWNWNTCQGFLPELCDA